MLECSLRSPYKGLAYYMMIKIKIIIQQTLLRNVLTFNFYLFLFFFRFFAKVLLLDCLENLEVTF